MKKCEIFNELVCCGCSIQLIVGGFRHYTCQVLYALYNPLVLLPTYKKNNLFNFQYAAVDRGGQCIAVAGKTGLAHYTFVNRKWKLFGNETQVYR